MPELPEVQTVLDTLALKIKDKEIKNIEVLYSNIIVGNIEEFKTKLIGQHFREFKRRGKYLLFVMDDLTLVSHLRMEGKYFIQDVDEAINKHTHVIFTLDDGLQLRYNDVRKFGRMEIMDKRSDYSIFKDLGPEPFSNDFNEDYILKYFNKNKKPLKEVLLDQSFVAGIGNIYADEIAFACGKNPLTPVCSLTREDATNIKKETVRILNGAIKAGGTTIRSYTSSLGVTGRFQLKLKVHTMTNCPICHSEIKKIRVGGRGTYYCPNCQKSLIMKIAITGTIGSGKSMVSEYLRNKGYEVFSCDDYNRQLLEKGEEGYNLIKVHFPQCFKDDLLNKKELAKIVFNDIQKRKELENILHPLILNKMIEEANKKDVFFAEVPLLFETNFDRYFDTNWLVVADEKTIVDRLLKRGHELDDALNRIKSQMSIDEKKNRANEIIYNNKDLKDLYLELDKLLIKYVG